MKLDHVARSLLSIHEDPDNHWRFQDILSQVANMVNLRSGKSTKPSKIPSHPSSKPTGVQRYKKRASSIKIHNSVQKPSLDLERATPEEYRVGWPRFPSIYVNPEPHQDVHGPTPVLMQLLSFQVAAHIKEVHDEIECRLAQEPASPGAEIAAAHLSQTAPVLHSYNTRTFWRGYSWRII